MKPRESEEQEYPASEDHLGGDEVLFGTQAVFSF